MTDDPEFEQLRREYHEALGKRAQEVGYVLGALREPQVPVNGDAWTRILYIAHKTAGLAATYDMPLLTDLCAALDEGMQQRASKHVVPSVAEFRGWCEVLEKALRLGAQGKDAEGLPVPQV